MEFRCPVLRGVSFNQEPLPTMKTLPRFGRTADALHCHSWRAAILSAAWAGIVIGVGAQTSAESNSPTLYGPNINPRDPYSQLPSPLDPPFTSGTGRSPWVTDLGTVTQTTLNKEANEVRSPATTAKETAKPEAKVYFPPLPPPLGKTIPKVPVSRTTATEMGPYVAEFFYPALAGRRQRGEMKARHYEELDRYRGQKTALQAELRNELAVVRDAEPAARLKALEALARTQTPKIAALEAAAEKLRVSLASDEHAWGVRRNWHLNDGAKLGYTPLEVSRVMRAAAYFQDGLRVEQRRLLLEIALETGGASLAESASLEDALSRQPYLFFSPAMTRVDLPEGLPPELAAKVAAYVSQKSAVKQELYAIIFKEDASYARLRSLRLRAFGAEQAPALRALEVAADEIRRGLAQLPSPYLRRRPESDLSASLIARVSELLVTQARAQGEIAAKVEELQAKYPKWPITFRFGATGLVYTVGDATGDFDLKSSVAKNEGSSPRLAIQTELSGMAQDYQKILAEIEGRQQEIRRDIAKEIHDQDPSMISAALSSAVKAAREQQQAETNWLYSTAIFEPGLSPEQRRLLADAAVVELGLSAPKGETQPTERMVATR